MVDAVQLLEKDTSIFRYSWFATRYTTDETSPCTNLFKQKEDGVLTDVGDVYLNMSSFDSTYFHPVESVIEAEHYIDRSGIYLEKTTDVSGRISMYDIQAGDWAEYLEDVPETTRPFIAFRYASAKQAAIAIYQGTDLLGTIILPSTGGVNTWTTWTSSLHLPSGKIRIRLKQLPPDSN